MRIQEIELAPPFEEELTVGLIQLRSPFFDAIDTVRRDDGHILAITEKTLPSYKSRVADLFHMLQQIQERFREIDLLVLPEYAFIKSDRGVLSDDKDTLELCRDFVAQSKRFLIGNYYDDTTRSSIAFFMAPAEYAKGPATRREDVSVFVASKFTRTPSEAAFLKPIQDVPDDETHVLRAWWRPEGAQTQAYLQVLTCKDYLYFTSIEPLRQSPDVVKIDKPGVIVVPACSTEIATFEGRAMVLMRDIEVKQGAKSIVSCFCNATSTTKQLSLQTTPMQGFSQVISPIDMHRQSKPFLRTGLEGLVVATLNPFRALARPTPTAEREANAVLLSSNVFEFLRSEDKTCHLSESPGTPRPHTGYVVNPRVLHSLGFRRVYGFLRLDDYPKFRELLKLRFSRYPALSIAVHGVFGIHDVLALSWEELSDRSNAREVLKMRLWPMIRHDADRDQTRLGCCVVERIMKFHGVNISAKGVDESRYRSSGDERFRAEIRALMHGESPADEDLRGLEEKAILLRTPYDTSDISDRERSEGKLEFLVLVRVLQSVDTLQAEGVKKEFERSLLQELIADERIRTIEEVYSEGAGYVEADYILHVVGDLGDLIALVVGKLHDARGLFAGDPPFRCKSMVVIPAESLSVANHPGLMEEPQIGAAEPNIFDIMNQWKKLEQDEHKMIAEMVPCSIRCIREPVMRKMFQAYFLADSLAKGHIRESGNWMPGFFSFLYAVSAAIGGERLGCKMTDADLVLRSTGFVAMLAREIERALGECFARVSKAAGMDLVEFEQATNDLIATFRQRGKLVAKRIEIGTAGFALEKLNALHGEKHAKKHIQWLMETSALPEDQAKQRVDNLRSGVESLSGLDIAETAKALEQFAKVRNAIAHLAEDNVEASSLLEGVFFGLRFLDSVVQHSELGSESEPPRHSSGG